MRMCLRIYAYFVLFYFGFDVGLFFYDYIVQPEDPDSRKLFKLMCDFLLFPSGQSLLVATEDQQEEKVNLNLLAIAGVCFLSTFIAEFIDMLIDLYYVLKEDDQKHMIEFAVMEAVTFAVLSVGIIGIALYFCKIRNLKCRLMGYGLSQARCKDVTTRPTPGGGPGHTGRGLHPSNINYKAPLCKERPPQGFDPARNVVYNLPRVVGMNEIRDVSQFICAPLRDTETGVSTISKRGGVAIKKYTQPTYSEGRKLAVNYEPEMPQGCVSLSHPATKSIPGAGRGNKSDLKFGDLDRTRSSVAFAGDGEPAVCRGDRTYTPSAKQPIVYSPFMKAEERYGSQNYPSSRFPQGEAPVVRPPIDYPPFSAPHGACTIGTDAPPAYGMVHRTTDECRETLRRHDSLSLGDRIKCPPKIFKDAASSARLETRTGASQTDQIQTPAQTVDECPPEGLTFSDKPFPPQTRKGDPCVLPLPSGYDELTDKILGNKCPTQNVTESVVTIDESPCLPRRGISEQRLRRVRGTNLGNF